MDDHLHQLLHIDTSNVRRRSRSLVCAIRDDKALQAHPWGIDGAFAGVEEHIVEPAAENTTEEGRDHWNLRPKPNISKLPSHCCEHQLQGIGLPRSNNRQQPKPHDHNQGNRTSAVGRSHEQS